MNVRQAAPTLHLLNLLLLLFAIIININHQTTIDSKVMLIYIKKKISDLINAYNAWTV